MCGIVGYIGKRQAVPILLAGLQSLEYRGYDSAGIAVIDDNKLCITRSKGKIISLKEEIGSAYENAEIGIGHTRWATHGRPSHDNSHPHTDCKDDFAVVHNGIIENYLQLRQELADKGHIFSSETDTEVIPHLLEEYYQGDLLEALNKTVAKLRGSYAIVVLSDHEPNKLLAARKDSPLIIGIGEGEYFFASDIPAIIEHTKKMIVMDDDDLAVLTVDGFQIYHDGKAIEKKIITIDWDREAAQKGGYEHFMLKEIHEQPMALRQTLKGRINDDRTEINLAELSLSAQDLANIKQIHIVACGTAYHAGLIGKYALEKLLRIPVNVEIASEYRYGDPLVDAQSLVIVVSQSGETADTLAALRESKSKGAHVIAITNVLGSSISREADDVIYTLAGPEIAVASTKAYITQLAAFYILTFAMAKALNKIDDQELAEIIQHFCCLPEKVEELLDNCVQDMQEIANDFKNWNDAFFVGRGMDYAVAMEGSLKLKEISYVHAEAYAAGELKHGTLALITKEVPVIALCTQRAVLEKTISNIKEIKARDAYTIGIAFEGDGLLDQVVDKVIYLPETIDLLAPILAVVPLQLLAYYAAIARECNVDQPRNLAKSVTVE